MFLVDMIGPPEIGIFSVSIIIIIIMRLMNYQPPSILNIYQRPNGFFLFKMTAAFLLLTLRKKIQQMKHFLFTNKDKQLREAACLDTHQKLSLNKLAVDAVYFNGANKFGDFFVVGTARRPNKLVDGFLYLKIDSSNLGILESLRLPETSLYQTDDIVEYSADNIKVSPVIPMKKWQITYKGKMKQSENEKNLYDVDVSLIWTSELPYFNFDTDIHPLAMAKSLAYEKWNRNYFKILKRCHQTHYEQFGNLEGKIKINDKTYSIELDTLRDHSFGEFRNWRHIYRYGLHFISVENGDRICVEKICMPIMLTRLTVGYIYCAKDEQLYPIASCDLALYQHGENGNPPSDYAFSFCTDERKYTVKVKVKDAPYFYISKDNENKIFEQLCSFEVNGLKGWGAAEWAYHNIDNDN